MVTIMSIHIKPTHVLQQVLFLVYCSLKTWNEWGIFLIYCQHLFCCFSLDLYGIVTKKWNENTKHFKMADPILRFLQDMINHKRAGHTRRTCLSMSFRFLDSLNVQFYLSSTTSVFRTLINLDFCFFSWLAVQDIIRFCVCAAST